MIINIRGTSGAGKTHLVRRLMSLSQAVEDWYGDKDAPLGLFGQPLAKPIGHHVMTPSGGVKVIGNYRGVQCGGCDQLMKGPWNLSRDGVYARIRQAHTLSDVLYEGLLISEVHRCAKLAADGYKVLVIHLSEDVEVCLASINARRAERGLGPVDPRHTVSKHRELINQSRRLMAAGVNVEFMLREQAYETVIRELGWM